MGILDNDFYLKMLISSNMVALLQMVLAIKWPRIARLSFFILFAWACWTNWTESRQNPEVYLNYANFAWIDWYRDFITGWFAQHVQLAILIIAACQGMIAFSMLLKGFIFRIGATGAIIFLLAISPLGIGAGFPCTVIMAIAIYFLLKTQADKFIWQESAKREKGVSLLFR